MNGQQLAAAERRIEELIQEAREVVITLSMSRSVAELYNFESAKIDLRHAHRTMSELLDGLDSILLNLEASTPHTGPVR